MFTRNKKATSLLKKQAAVIIRKRDSSSAIEKKLYLYGSQTVENPTIHHIFNAAAGCAEVAGVELELTSYKEEECFTGEVEMIVPEIHWEIETPSSDEATEGASSYKVDNGTPNNIIEALGVGALSRTLSNKFDRSGNQQADRKDSRRHTMSVLTPQFLLVPFSVQLAQAGANCAPLEPV
uniref:Uncharacterized protein n=1 Tax=Acrobeloides nanus TaxID=290746 RepID=A0A914CQX6_9BILA